MTQSPAATPERTPTVLVVLVARDAAAWLRETIAALAAQSYPRMAVLGVDDGSDDDTRQILEQALGERRVIALPDPGGLAPAFREAMEQPAASEADLILLLHDDAALDPDAVQRLVEAAVGIRGLDEVGIVGCKVVDWDEPRRLLDVGRSADIFGHAYTPLQPDEIDQGQFDRVLEVLCVSSSAMLIARAAWKRAGLLDERLDTEHQGLDLCWRVRLAGFRVVMMPLARVRHREVTRSREHARRSRRHSMRYEEDRAAIATMAKNYGLISLFWVTPLALLLGLVRLLFLTLARRFEEAYDVLSAWGWNAAHVGGTLSRRRRIQRERRVKDRTVRRFMETAGVRLPRWFQTAERILVEQREIDERDEDETTSRRLRDRTASLVGSHPVIVGSFLGIVVGAVTIRFLFGADALAGGVLPAFPAGPDGFWAELVSAYRTTPLGGTLAASPALGALGGLSWLMLGSASLAQKVVLAGAPVLAAILTYRAAIRLTGRPGPSVLASGVYVLCGLTLWSFSQGRLDLLVALAVLPAIFERIETAFGPDEPQGGRRRFAAGVGVTLAVLVAFLPGALLAVGVLVVVQLVAGSSRARGLASMALASAIAAVLLFPFVPTLAAGGGAALVSQIGTSDLSQLARLAPGDGPGTWVVALFLPVAALLSFALVGAELRGRAVRAVLVVLVALALSWLSAAWWVPAPLSNPLAYLAVAAVGEVMLVAYGVSSAVTGLGREAFGMRQILTAMLAVVIGGGLLLQSIAALVGGWAVGGPEQVPAAWSVLESTAKGDFRVLWVGSHTNDPFPAPGGDPSGLAESGRATLRYGLTGRDGTVAIDLARPSVGPGPDHLREALDEILAGTTRHGGALLAPFGVRFVIAADDDVPPQAQALLDAQVDLDLVPAAGLVVYRNARAISPAAVLEDDPLSVEAMRSSDPPDVVRASLRRGSPLAQVMGGWEGGEGSGPVYVSTEFQGAWQLEGSEDEPLTAFGWATGFETQQAPVAVRYGSQLPATIQVWLLGLVWAVALWVTRKPVAR
ncbi:MAG TPA: glycosyltransferase family 2 protein [Actinomycetota bacterium]|nr:glycosyltransferase family 2 protein [Actinomycetota bacterium]